MNIKKKKLRNHFECPLRWTLYDFLLSVCPLPLSQLSRLKTVQSVCVFVSNISGDVCSQSHVLIKNPRQLREGL